MAKVAEPEAQKPTVYYGASAPIPREATEAMARWVNHRLTPGGETRAGSLAARLKMTAAAMCGMTLDGPRGYTLIITSGASEANSHIITSSVRSFSAKTGRLPHIIIGGAEHSSIAQNARRLADEKLAELTILPLGVTGVEYGLTSVSDLKRVLRPNTCLISISAVQRGIGLAVGVGRIKQLAALAGSKNIPFHSDIALAVGRMPINADASGVDAFSFSFHRLHAPPGVGILAIRKSFAAGYDIGPLVCGAAAPEIRGGAANVIGQAATVAACGYTQTGRAKKDANISAARRAFRQALEGRAAVIDACSESAIPDLKRALAEPAPIFWWLSPEEKSAVNVVGIVALGSPNSAKKRKSTQEVHAEVSKQGFITELVPPEETGILVALRTPPVLGRHFIRVTIHDNVKRSDLLALALAEAAR